MKTLKFTKMQAYGNDYVYIDAIHQEVSKLPELARFVSNRHFGVGSDGMVLICPSQVSDFRMRMFNPDGSEGEMCGNALRSVAKYVYDHGFTDKTRFQIETFGGLQNIELEVKDQKAVNITADIGKPRFSCREIPVNSHTEEFIDQPVEILDRTFRLTAMSWGNPHCVAFVDRVMEFEVEKYGRAIEHCTELFPNKTNVTFAQVVNEDYLLMREWERGTGETIGCGTGCCTALVAGALLGYTGRQATVEQIGGPLHVKWDKETDHMIMTGTSHTVFESEIGIDFL